MNRSEVERRFQGIFERLGLTRRRGCYVIRSEDGFEFGFDVNGNKALWNYSFQPFVFIDHKRLKKQLQQHTEYPLSVRLKDPLWFSNVGMFASRQLGIKDNTLTGINNFTPELSQWFERFESVVRKAKAHIEPDRLGHSHFLKLLKQDRLSMFEQNAEKLIEFYESGADI